MLTPDKQTEVVEMLIREVAEGDKTFKAALNVAFEAGIQSQSGPKSVCGYTLREDDMMNELLGKVVFIQTVTMYYEGTLIGVGPTELEIDGVTWIADTGKFCDAIAGKSPYSDAEKLCDGITFVNRGACIMTRELTHKTAKR